MASIESGGGALSRYVVEEKDGEFVLPLAGFVCSEVGHELIVRSAATEEEAELLALDEDMSLRLVERGAHLEWVAATRESTLHLSFDGGVAIAVPAADEVEAWEVRGAGPILVVASVGGGEPHIWDASTETFTIRPGDPLPPELTEAIESFDMSMPGEIPKGEGE